jgi:hypothetical protein
MVEAASACMVDSNNSARSVVEAASACTGGSAVIARSVEGQASACTGGGSKDATIASQACGLVLQPDLLMLRDLARDRGPQHQQVRLQHQANSLQPLLVHLLVSQPAT